MINITQEESMRNWGNANVPLVSIKCFVYNHENYVSQALDGFLMQKTNFPFEVIIHDDASTDGSAKIIKEYEKKYPLIIKPIYESENQYSKQDGSLDRAIDPFLKGKYIALCEGDDYWIDENKLQLQVDFLERNLDCSLALCNGYIGSNLNDKRIINPYGRKNTGFLTSKQLLISKGGLVPTASMVFRKEFLNRPEVLKECPVGDKPIRMWCMLNGKIYFDKKPMVFYRTMHSDSFGSLVSSNREKALEIYTKFVDFLNRFNFYTRYEYSREIEYMKQKEEMYYLERIHCKYEASKCAFNYNIYNFSLRSILKNKAPKLFGLLKKIKYKLTT